MSSSSAKLKTFRQSVTKSKKKVVSCAIMTVDTYSEWKVDSLKRLHATYEAEGRTFKDSFRSDLKVWAASLPDKKNMKNIMQFLAFVKKEVGDVGASAMDFTSPFDQKATFERSRKYVASQLGIEEGALEIVNLSV